MLCHPLLFFAVVFPINVMRMRRPAAVGQRARVQAVTQTRTHVHPPIHLWMPAAIWPAIPMNNPDEVMANCQGEKY
jgi:hypothetical protein